jgi:thiol-disulfide isomerase/thioredoxin
MDANESFTEPRRTSAGRWMFLAVICAAVLVWVVVATRPRPRPPGTEGPGVGQRLPTLRLEPLTGNSEGVTLADLNGRVTLLNFWGTWCGPCVLEFPHLVELSKQFADKPDFRFYPVSCGTTYQDDFDELRSETESFLKARMVELATYADPGAESRRALTMAGGFDDYPGYPTTVVLDRHGVIRGLWVGYDPRSIDQMKSLVGELLEKPADHPDAVYYRSDAADY